MGFEPPIVRAGKSLKKLISPDISTPELPDEAGPESQDTQAALAKERERRRRARQGGRASTILTSPLGITARANVATKTLLGA